MKTLSHEMALTAEVALYFGAYEHYKHLAISGKPLSLVGLCPGPARVQAVCDSGNIS